MKPMKQMREFGVWNFFGCFDARVMVHMSYEEETENVVDEDG